MHRDLKVQGHRGCAAQYPENSIEGVCQALASGAFAVEIDVQLTGDERLIVAHDALLTPPGYLVDEALAIADHPLHSMVGIWFGDGRDPRFLHLNPARFPLQVPSLDALLEHPSIPIEKVNIELKEDPKQRNMGYAAALSRCLGKRKAFRIKSFDLDLLTAVYQMLPEQSFHFLLPEDWDGSLIQTTWFNDRTWIEGVCMHYSQVKDDTVDRFFGLGLHVSVYTVNSFSILEELYRKGVRDILTDDPAAMIDQLVFHNRDSNASERLT